VSDIIHVFFFMFILYREIKKLLSSSFFLDLFFASLKTSNISFNDLSGSMSSKRFLSSIRHSSLLSFFRDLFLNRTLKTE